MSQSAPTSSLSRDKENTATEPIAVNGVVNGTGPDDLATLRGEVHPSIELIDRLSRIVDHEIAGKPELTRYQRVAELGRGGCGVVDRVIDRRLQREVAVKRATSADSLEVRTRFLHEAKITSQLQHPGVVPVHELSPGEDGTHGGEAFYVMKLLEGSTFGEEIRRLHQLRTRRRSSGQLDDTLVPLLERFVHVCNAVAYAHERGIIHRDLKPANIMIGSFGETVVLDWGLAKCLSPSSCDEADARESVEFEESPGQPIGTPAYMSPEQACGAHSIIDRASDIYSLGVILYEIITGSTPYRGQNVYQVIAKVKSVSAPLDPSAAEPKVARPLARIVQVATAVDASQRYASAEHLADDVRRYLVGDAVSVYEETIIDRASRWCRRNRAVATTIAISTAVLLVASIAFSVVIHRAHQAERVARLDAEYAHDVALLRLIEARDMADTWINELGGTLASQPGLQPLREQLLRQAMAHYESLVESPGDLVARSSTDSLTRLEQTKCLIRLGDLYHTLGDDQLAAMQYDRAEAALDQVRRDAARARIQSGRRAETNSNVAVLARMEQIHTAIGRMRLNRVATNAHSLDSTLLDSHRDWLEAKIREVWGDDVTVRSPAVTANEFTADVLATAIEFDITRLASSESDDPQGMSTRTRAAHRSRWLVHHRGNASDHRLCINAFTDLANAYERRGELENAIEAWSGLVDSLNYWSSQEVDRADWLMTMSTALLRRALRLAELERFDAAVSDCDEALREISQARELDNDANYLNILNTAQDMRSRYIREGT